MFQGFLCTREYFSTVLPLRKSDVLGEKTAVLILAVTDIEDGAEPLCGDFHQEIEQGHPVVFIKPLGRLVEDEQAGHLDQGPGQQNQPLFAVAELTEGGSCLVGQAESL